MKSSVRVVSIFSLVTFWGTLAALAGLAACGSDDRPTFVAGPDATPDVPARLPDAEPYAPTDAGVDVVAPVVVDASDEPVVCEVTPCAVQLAAGDTHFCARMSDGTVRCWGDDTAGALGRGEPGDAGAPASPGSPRPVSGLHDVVQISAGRRTTCALDGAGVVRCWGSNELAQLGLRADPAQVDSDRHATPTEVATSGTFSRVDVGVQTACAVTSTGGAVCWGDNGQKQLARTDGPPFAAGPGAADLHGYVLRRTGGTRYTSFGLTVGGELLSWGLVSGLGTASGRYTSISPDPVPVVIPTLSRVTSFGAGDFHACAIENGVVFCWGQSDRAALCTGLPDREEIPAPASIDSEAWPQQLALGKTSTCVRMTDGSIQCCGDDRKGQLGSGKVGVVTASFTPAKAFTGYAVQVEVSDGATCALLRGGSVQCWGTNEHGQLGRGDRDGEPHPVPAPVAF